MIACGLGKALGCGHERAYFSFYLGSHSRVSVEFPSSGSSSPFGSVKRKE